MVLLERGKTSEVIKALRLLFERLIEGLSHEGHINGCGLRNFEGRENIPYCVWVRKLIERM